jgi:hypothetical protein
MAQKGLHTQNYANDSALVILGKSIKTKHKNHLNFEPARHRIEALAYQKQAKSSH